MRLRDGGPGWLRGTLLTAGGALGGAALGALPDLASGPPGSGPLWAEVALGGSGAACYLSWAVLAGRRRRALRTRGVVVVIREPSTDWSDERSFVDRFLSSLRASFRSVKIVPGPSSRRFSWSLEHGLAEWDDQVGSLVSAVRTVLSDEPETEVRSLMVWAWWPVALVVAARIRSGNLAEQLRVCRRPSVAGDGTVAPYDARWPLLDFSRPSAPSSTARIPAPTVGEHRVRLEIAPPNSTAPPDPHGPQVCLLVLRLTGGPWGPLDDTPPSAPGRNGRSDRPRPTIKVEDHSGQGLVVNRTTTAWEWRCRPRDGSPYHAWRDYEPLARAAATWLHDRVNDISGQSVVLIGATLPQEISVGLGVELLRLLRHGWPDDVWPLQWRGSDSTFVIPALSLGRTSLLDGPSRVHRPT